MMDACITNAFDLADFDGDGDLAIDAGPFGEKIVFWHENDGQGNFIRHVIDQGHEQESYDLKITDLDGDERPDILLGGRRSNNVVFYYQLTSPRNNQP